MPSFCRSSAFPAPDSWRICGVLKVPPEMITSAPRDRLGNYSFGSGNVSSVSTVERVTLEILNPVAGGLAPQEEALLKSTRVASEF